LKGRAVYFLLSFTLLLSCTHHPPRVATRGFYYWKTSFRLSDWDKKELQELKIKKLYIRFFDVAFFKKDSCPRPVQPVTFVSPVPQGIEVVPVIFLTNETIQRTDSVQIPLLARHIARMIDLMTKQYSLNSVTEIQLDCDWSRTTKDKYFYLIRSLRYYTDSLHWHISATLRLFQARYPSIAGIPPVDRVTLMAYNMSDIKNEKAENSIMNYGLEKSYLSNFESYPLKADVVLPIFYWGVLFRNGVFAGILNNLKEEEIKGNYSPLTPKGVITGQLYRAEKETDMGAFHLEKGDLIRLESCNPDDMEKSIALIAAKNNIDSLCCSFFSFDSLLIAHIGVEALEKDYSLYR
jgi:hypothetical protein